MLAPSGSPSPSSGQVMVPVLQAVSPAPRHRQHVTVGTPPSSQSAGPIEGTPVHIAGLFGGGLHSTTPDGWTLDVVSPEWPHDRVILSADGGSHKGPTGGTWWHIFHSEYSELRAAGFSPSGLTLAVATSSDLTLWTRPDLHFDD